MAFSEEIRIIRKKALLSQEAFAGALGVSFSTVNRWENGKGMPNFSAMKAIKSFCNENNISYAEVEKEWFAKPSK